MADKLKLLLVDSERYRKIMLNILTRDARLRSLDLEVLEAGDGLEAFELFKAEQPSIIITELLLPRLSGFELIRKVRNEKAGKDVPILLVTGLSRDMTSINVLKRSFNVVLQVKPFTPWDFALSISKQLAPLRKNERDKRDSERNKSDSKPRLGGRKKTPTGTFSQDETQPGLKDPTLVDIRFDVPGLREKDSSNMDLTESAVAARSSRRFTQGNISDHPLPELLLDALEKRLSGTLALRLRDIKKVVYLLSGHPIYVQSNLRRETIGQTLVRRRTLNSDQNTRALAEAKRSGVPYGQALVQLGFMTANAVKQELLANIRHKIQASLDWNRGHWLFVEDSDIGSKVPRCVLDPVPLIFGGLKEVADPEKSMQRLGRHLDLEVVIPRRIKNYQEAFVATFGDAALKAYEPGMSVTDLAQAGGNPQESMFQLDMMLRCGLARVRRANSSVHELPKNPQEDDSEAIIIDEAPTE